METRKLGPWDYDELQACPFCGYPALPFAMTCPHFVAAFQHGSWAHDLCPPYVCDGFRYDKEKVLAELHGLPDVIQLLKPGTRRHPRIEGLFCADQAVAERLKKETVKVPAAGVECGTCGNRTGVVGECGDIICAACGEAAYLTES